MIGRQEKHSLQLVDYVYGSFDTPALINCRNGQRKDICEPESHCLNVRPRVSLHAPLIFFIGQAIQAIVITALSAPAIHNGSCTFAVAADI